MFNFLKRDKASTTTLFQRGLGLLNQIDTLDSSNTLSPKELQRRSRLEQGLGLIANALIVRTDIGTSIEGNFVQGEGKERIESRYHFQNALERMIRRPEY